MTPQSVQAPTVTRPQPSNVSRKSENYESIQMFLFDPVDNKPETNIESKKQEQLRQGVQQASFALPSKMHKNIIEDWRTRNEAEILARTQKLSRSPSNQHADRSAKTMSRRNANEFYARQVSKQVDKQLKDEMLRSRKEQADLKECTFHPNITTQYKSAKPGAGSSNPSPGPVPVEQTQYETNQKKRSFQEFLKDQ